MSLDRKIRDLQREIEKYPEDERLRRKLYSLQRRLIPAPFMGTLMGLYQNSKKNHEIWRYNGTYAPDYKNQFSWGRGLSFRLGSPDGFPLDFFLNHEVIQDVEDIWPETDYFISYDLWWHVEVPEGDPRELNAKIFSLYNPNSGWFYARNRDVFEDDNTSALYLFGQAIPLNTENELLIEMIQEMDKNDSLEEWHEERIRKAAWDEAYPEFITAIEGSRPYDMDNMDDATMRELFEEQLHYILRGYNYRHHDSDSRILVSASADIRDIHELADEYRGISDETLEDWGAVRREEEW